MAYINRRRFLGVSAALTGSSLLTALTAGTATAADTSGYKALVCVFFKGGLDQWDTVIPTDAASYNMLKSHRSGLLSAHGVDRRASSRDRDALLRLTPGGHTQLGGRSFGLPTQLNSLHDMYEAGDLAIIGNVGPLIEPVSRPDMRSGARAIPNRLFSHNDQQSTWMSSGVEGAQYGWGGRFADAVIRSDRSNNPLYTAMATGHGDVFLAGEATRQFLLPDRNALDIALTTDRRMLGTNGRYDAGRKAFADFVQNNETEAANLFIRDYAKMAGNGAVNAGIYRDAISGAGGLSTNFPGTPLGAQLQKVAEAISQRKRLEVKRQVFYVTIGGFDTHSSQAFTMAGLQTQINDAFAAFRAAMIEAGTWNATTLFTASDFGRTTIDNGDGTDHGWGGHQFVMGGAVKGGGLYGDFPPPEIGSDRYTKKRGRLIPTTSVDQYAATLGKWFGLNTSDLNYSLPNLENFNTRDLGFL